MTTLIEEGRVGKSVSPTVFPSIIFIFGPSGVGKSEFAQYLGDKLSFYHLETDLPDRNGILVENLKSEWSMLIKDCDAVPIRNALRNRISKLQTSGLIVSFSSVVCLSDKHLITLLQNEIAPIILFAEKHHCLCSFLQRENETKRNLDASHWYRHNKHFNEFGRTGIEQFRVWMYEGEERKTHSQLYCEIKRVIEEMLNSSLAWK